MDGRFRESGRDAFNERVNSTTTPGARASKQIDRSIKSHTLVPIRPRRRGGRRSLRTFAVVSLHFSFRFITPALFRSTLDGEPVHGRDALDRLALPQHRVLTVHRRVPQRGAGGVHPTPGLLHKVARHWREDEDEDGGGRASAEGTGRTSGRRRERARLGSFVRAPMYLKGFCKPASFLRHPSCETRREGRGDGEFGRTNDSRATTRRGALGRD
jgi:hypothetical protein